jgi:predicted TIM-barrel fold metal-dependent hydrolase
VDTRVWASRRQLGPAIERALRRRAETRFVLRDGNEAELVAAVRELHRVLLLGFRSVHLGADIGAEFLHEVVRRHPGRLLLAAGIDPLARSWSEEFDHARALGCVAISISPSAQSLPPTHSDAMRLFERCAAARLPVIVSRPGPLAPEETLEFDRPLLWEEPLRAFPELTVLLADMGWPHVDETIAMMEKHERLHAHPAGLLGRPLDTYRALAAAIERGVVERICFASGFPARTPREAAAALFALPTILAGTGLPPIPRRLLRELVDRDALACLGIPEPVGFGSEPAPLSTALDRLP